MSQPSIARALGAAASSVQGDAKSEERPSTSKPARGGRIAKLVDSDRFEFTITGVIAANAIVLALGTYPGLEEGHGELFAALNLACYLVFVVEIILRIASYGRHPLQFFRTGWNVFDFTIVAIALVPGVRQNATLLRLARVLRIVRIVKFFPDAQVILRAIRKSIVPLLTFAGLMLLLMFIYAMLGWALFSTKLPEHWGDLTTSMKTLFIMLTLENFPNYMEAALEVRPLAWMYFLSFVVIAAFIILNVIIGIVLNSLEEARFEQQAEARGVSLADGEPTRHELADGIAELRGMLAQVQLSLAGDADGPSPNGDGPAKDSI